MKVEFHSYLCMRMEENNYGNEAIMLFFFFFLKMMNIFQEKLACNIQAWGWSAKKRQRVNGSVSAVLKTDCFRSRGFTVTADFIFSPSRLLLQTDPK